MKNFACCLLVLISLLAQAQTFTVETVPDPRRENGSHVSDPSGILSASARDSINQMLDRLESATTAQVAVVMLPSVGDVDEFTFAQKLFTTWKIGMKDKDNGLLILFIQDQRKIRFHTGFGLEGVLTDVRCKQIQENYMVPSFKKGDFDEGMIMGVDKTVAVLMNTDAAEEITSGATSDANAFFYMFISIFCGVLLFIALIFEILNGKFSTKPNNEPHLRINAWLWFFMYAFIPVTLVVYGFIYEMPILRFFLIAIFLILFWFIEKFTRTVQMANALDAPSAYHLYNNEAKFWKIASFVFPLPAFIGFSFFRKRSETIRFGARSCKQCGSAMHRETENTEDRYMKKGQILEEKIGVTDYDVWRCVKCSCLETIPYPDFTNRAMYESCSSCGFITMRNVTSRTLTEATYDHDGKGEKDYQCMQCKVRKTVPYIIPMLVAASSSSSSSDSDYSSSSSSDSGGSDWGGGDSGGGGASSSW